MVEQRYIVIREKCKEDEIALTNAIAQYEAEMRDYTERLNECRLLFKVNSKKIEVIDKEIRDLQLKIERCKLKKRRLEV